MLYISLFFTLLYLFHNSESYPRIKRQGYGYRSQYAHPIQPVLRGNGYRTPGCYSCTNQYRRPGYQRGYYSQPHYPQQGYTPQFPNNWTPNYGFEYQDFGGNANQYRNYGSNGVYPQPDHYNPYPTQSSYSKPRGGGYGRPEPINTYQQPQRGGYGRPVGVVPVPGIGGMSTNENYPKGTNEDVPIDRGTPFVPQTTEQTTMEPLPDFEKENGNMGKTTVDSAVEQTEVVPSTHIIGVRSQTPGTQQKGSELGVLHDDKENPVPPSLPIPIPTVINGNRRGPPGIATVPPPPSTNEPMGVPTITEIDTTSIGSSTGTSESTVPLPVDPVQPPMPPVAPPPPPPPPPPPVLPPVPLSPPVPASVPPPVPSSVPPPSPPVPPPPPPPPSLMAPPPPPPPPPSPPLPPPPPPSPPLPPPNPPSSPSSSGIPALMPDLPTEASLPDFVIKQLEKLRKEKGGLPNTGLSR